LPQLNQLLVIADMSAPHLSVLNQLPARVVKHGGTRLEELLPYARQADVVLNGSHDAAILRQLWPELERVHWIHTLSAGVDQVLFPELVASALPLTNSRGVFSHSLAEFAIGAMVYFAKDFVRLRRQQGAKQWQAFNCDELRHRTLGILGYGDIGRHVAERARAFGMKVMALRRRVDRSQDDPLVDVMLGMEDKARLLSESDYIVMALPNMPDTQRFVAAAELAMMKPSAVLINLGRGTAIDEAALHAALSGQRIRGAALDVFAVEPLPASSPLWELDNLLLSPHCTDNTQTWRHEATGLFVENVSRWEAGLPLHNMVDKQVGY
jgi:phosphoglycerate dehydrogenase-like enzyme